jgi:hypothetical protein
MPLKLICRKLRILEQPHLLFYLIRVTTIALEKTTGKTVSNPFSIKNQEPSADRTDKKLGNLEMHTSAPNQNGRRLSKALSFRPS